MNAGILAAFAATIGCGVVLALHEVYLAWQADHPPSARQADHPPRRPVPPMPPTPEDVADRMVAALSAGHNTDGYAEPGLALSATWVGSLYAWDLQVEGVSHLHFSLQSLRDGIVRAVRHARAVRATRRGAP
jgi:hypothetical protein